MKKNDLGDTTWRRRLLKRGLELDISVNMQLENVEKILEILNLVNSKPQDLLRYDIELHFALLTLSASCEMDLACSY